MKLIKLLQDKNYAELKDYLDSRISHAVVDRIVSRKEAILNNIRGITESEGELSEHRGMPAKENKGINLFYDLIPGDVKSVRDLRKMSDKQYVTMSGELEALSVQVLRSNISKLKALKDKFKDKNDEFMSANLKILSKLYNEALQNKLKGVTEALAEMEDKPDDSEEK